MPRGIVAIAFSYKLFHSSRQSRELGCSRFNLRRCSAVPGNNMHFFSPEKYYSVQLNRIFAEYCPYVKPSLFRIYKHPMMKLQRTLGAAVKGT